MYFATIDCGTTNSRVYVLNEDLEVVNRGEKKVGVKDTAINGSNQVLKNGLKDVFIKTVTEAGLNTEEIKFVITSGMITSEIGLIEIPHLWAPAGLKELAENIKVVNDKEVFPVDVPMIFIRGIKNFFPEKTTYRDIRKIDFMRGEETQAVGLLTLYPDLELPINLVVLSSHTKYIHINAGQKVCGSLTTMSGQVYEAVRKETFVGKSIQGDNDGSEDDYFNEEIIETAYDSVMNSGFIRTLLMPRFMEVLLKTTWYERKLFVEAAIIAEDLRALNEYDNLQFSRDCGFILVGHEIRCRVMAYLLEKYLNVSNIKMVYNKVEIDRLSIEGAIAIVR